MCGTSTRFAYRMARRDKLRQYLAQAQDRNGDLLPCATAPAGLFPHADVLRRQPAGVGAGGRRSPVAADFSGVIGGRVGNGRVSSFRVLWSPEAGRAGGQTAEIHRCRKSLADYGFGRNGLAVVASFRGERAKSFTKAVLRRYSCLDKCCRNRYPAFGSRVYDGLVGLFSRVSFGTSLRHRPCPQRPHYFSTGRQPNEIDVCTTLTCVLSPGRMHRSRGGLWCAAHITGLRQKRGRRHGRWADQGPRRLHRPHLRGAVFTAVEKGFFKEEGLDVELVRCQWATYKDALALGRYDVTHHLVMYFLKPIEQGMDVKFTGGIHRGCLRVQAAARRADPHDRGPQGQDDRRARAWARRRSCSPAA